MRINVYSQEINLNTSAVELVEQQADTGITYGAVRLFLHSSDRLHDVPGDDDRSAITFWLPKSRNKRDALAILFHRLGYLVGTAPPETGMD
jgi:hypothetical protein